MELRAWLNFLSPEGPCLDPTILPIPGSPVSLAMIDSVAKAYATEHPGKTIRILEVGCFVGISAITWGKALQEAGVQDWRIYCCDMWHHFGNQSLTPTSTVVDNQRNSFNHEVFKFNVQKAFGFDHIVEVIGDSRQSLDALRDGYFDIVYVDGYHGYSVVASDLRQALRLTRKGGIICGDDYDCTAPMLAQIPASDRELDGQVIDGWWGVHAGVVQAVDELLGQPRVYGTFWAFKRDADGVSAIDVSKLRRRVPTFIPAGLRPGFEAWFAAPHGMLPVGHPFAAR